MTPSGAMLQVEVPHGLGLGGSFIVSVPDAAPVGLNAPVDIAALTTVNPLQERPAHTDHQPSPADPEAGMATAVNKAVEV
jgi:hypothetical protein